MVGLGDIEFCDMRLLHESFNVIIAILHVKIETQPHSLKSPYDCLFSLRISLQTQLLC